MLDGLIRFGVSGGVAGAEVAEFGRGDAFAIMVRIAGSACGLARSLRNGLPVSAASLMRRKQGRARLILASVIAFVEASSLSGCGADGVRSLLVDPAHYNGYRCTDLVSASQALAKREKDLRNLMSKADESRAGAVIGAFAYRSDYETVLEEEKVLRRTAADKKCELTPTFSSDKTIR